MPEFRGKNRVSGRVVEPAGGQRFTPAQMAARVRDYNSGTQNLRERRAKEKADEKAKAEEEQLDAAAARLRLVVDRRLGRETPKSVVRLAEGS